jgi:hypothetical protein
MDALPLGCPIGRRLDPIEFRVGTAFGEQRLVAAHLDDARQQPVDRLRPKKSTASLNRTLQSTTT